MSAGESCSSGSSARIFLSNMGYSDPLYTLRQLGLRAAQRFRRRRQLLDRRSGAAILLAVLRGDPRRHRAPAVAARDRPWPWRAASKRMRRQVGATPLAIAGVAAVAMAATGAYAYHNIKQLNRYQTSDEAEKYQRGL